MYVQYIRIQTQAKKLLQNWKNAKKNSKIFVHAQLNQNKIMMLKVKKIPKLSLYLKLMKRKKVLYLFSYFFPSRSFKKTNIRHPKIPWGGLTIYCMILILGAYMIIIGGLYKPYVRPDVSFISSEVSHTSQQSFLMAWMFFKMEFQFWAFIESHDKILSSISITRNILHGQ